MGFALELRDMRRVAMRTIHEVEVELIAPSLSAGRILYFGYSGLTVSSVQLAKGRMLAAYPTSFQQ
ncbi:hypothetical protein [Synechococcus sp. PCC 7335]|uniref:hypothetical protein n=1 Tax=Synechococcus sp. (strain ATCC 29403 / PCC 7335) TaxID=91464 RepID=UPI0002EEBD4C|nr:hypothetical protein [Synechococcus sp. PCC 7335]